MSEFKIVTADSVKINISNTQNDVITFEKKFDKKLTILELKVIAQYNIFYIDRPVFNESVFLLIVG